MKNELVQMTDLVTEARLAVAALFGGTELMLEQRVVLGANDGKVVTHNVAYRIDYVFGILFGNAESRRCVIEVSIGSSVAVRAVMNGMFAQLYTVT